MTSKTLGLDEILCGKRLIGSVCVGVFSVVRREWGEDYFLGFFCHFSGTGLFAALAGFFFGVPEFFGDFFF